MLIFEIRKSDLCYTEKKESRKSGLTNAKTELIKVHFRSKKEPNIEFGAYVNNTTGSIIAGDLDAYLPNHQQMV